MTTRKEVAALAGVSKTTVSRVLNNNGYVSPENRQKIENAIKELDYSPDLIARSLKTKETRQLLFHTPELYNPFFIEVYQGMEDYAEKHGYTIVVSRHYERGMIRQRQFDGILLARASSEQQQDLLSLNIPAVVTDYSDRPLSIPSVRIDIEDGTTKAMDFLRICGHHNVAFLANSSDLQDLRLRGYKKARSGLLLPGFGYLTTVSLAVCLSRHSR